MEPEAPDREVTGKKRAVELAPSKDTLDRRGATLHGSSFEPLQTFYESFIQKQPLWDI